MLDAHCKLMNKSLIVLLLFFTICFSLIIALSNICSMLRYSSPTLLNDDSTDTNAKNNIM